MSSPHRKRGKFTKFLGFMIIPVILFGGILLFYKMWFGIQNNSTDKNIEFIQDHINSSGQIIDYEGQIRANSIDDIKLFVDDDKIQIDYGILTLTWTIQDFVSTEVGKQLETIKITRYKDADTGRLRVFWYDEEVERWVH